MPAEVHPYLVPAPGTVVMTPWLWAVDEDEWDVLPADVLGWDPSMSLHLTRSVTVDMARFAAQTGLASGHSIALTVSWQSWSSGMKGRGSSVQPVGPEPTRLDLVLPGDRLSNGGVELRTTLTLATAGADDGIGAPRIPGSVLADHRQRLLLDASNNRFPVHVIDFAATRLDDRASWHLETTVELETPFLGGFLLLLNSRDTELTAAVSRGRKDSRQETLVDELESGVAALLLEFAAQLRPEIEARPAWPADSVGDVLAGMLHRAGRTGGVTAPDGPESLARARTRIAGAVRAAGHGRQLK